MFPLLTTSNQPCLPAILVSFKSFSYCLILVHFMMKNQIDACYQLFTNLKWNIFHVFLTCSFQNHWYQESLTTVNNLSRNRIRKTVLFQMNQFAVCNLIVSRRAGPPHGQPHKSDVPEECRVPGENRTEPDWYSSGNRTSDRSICSTVLE